jgi:low affinity Fe/Cu permease
VIERWFTRFATRVAHATGHWYAFVLAVAFIGGWAIGGIWHGFTDTWQLIVNTATTIITFLMVFVIQSTQNRDTEALHAKMDEVIRALPEADDDLRGLEREGEA